MRSIVSRPTFLDAYNDHQRGPAGTQWSHQWKLEPNPPPFAEICLLTRGGFSVVSAQNPQIFACGPIKIALENEYIEHCD